MNKCNFVINILDLYGIEGSKDDPDEFMALIMNVHI
jgi:hypothetical protein